MATSLDTQPQAKPLTYNYVVASDQGREMRGTLKATSEIDARRQLTERGFRVISLEVAPSPWSLEQMFPTLFQVKTREVVVFSRQLATLLQSGITLMPALGLLQSQVAASRQFRRILAAVAADLSAGHFFSQALGRHPRVFTDIYVSTVAVGERTGRLEAVLRQLADYYEKQGALAKKLKGALTYPAMVLIFSVVVGVILTRVALPPLVGMFQTLNVKLPLPTRMLIGFTNLVNNNGLLLLIGFLVILAGAIWFFRQPKGRQMWNRLKFTAPFIGPPTHLGELARFSRTVSLLVASGLPLQEIMALMPNTTTNSLMRESLIQIRESLMLGQGLSGPMSQDKVFPPLLVQMVAVGEESNSLDFTMGVVADFYETTAEEKMTALVAFMQPALTIGMSIVTAFIALSVIMPMYSITQGF